MSEVLAIINQLTADIRTLVLALLVLVAFYELCAALIRGFNLPKIGVWGVLAVALGFVVLPSLINYLTSMGA
jgi:hypothetical protein